MSFYRIGSIIRIEIDRTWKDHFPQGVGILGPGSTQGWHVLWPTTFNGWYEDEDITVLRDADDAMELAAYRMCCTIAVEGWHEYAAMWQQFMTDYGAGLDLR